MFIDTNLLDDGFTTIWVLHKCPIGKVLSRMEKELEWESSNVAIKTKLNKQQNQRSGCLLLTLKQKDQAILQNPSTSFMVKSSRNNGGKGPKAHLCSRDGRGEEEEDGCSLFMLLAYHRRFLARTDSDRAQSLSALGLNRQWYVAVKPLPVRDTNRKW